MNEKQIKKLTFEQAMEEMAKVVAELEQGDIPLEKSMELFQTGMLLSKICGERLNDVENKINTLVNGKNGLELKSIQIENE
jgi:exodeoxyribonuclease VII small subunit